MSGLTHIDASGTASMVDVSDKAMTERVGIAEGSVRMEPQTLALIKAGDARKAMFWALPGSRGSWQQRKPMTSFHCVIHFY